MSQSVLDTNVLILNRFYMAIRVVNVRRAFTLLYRECAEVIDNENGQYVSYDFSSWCELSQLTSLEKQPGEDYIRAVGFELQVPRIVRLIRFDRMPQQSVRFNRKNLFARDEHRCQYCGRSEPTHQLSLDHVIPRSLGGPTTWENIVCCCLPLQQPQRRSDSQPGADDVALSTVQASLQPADRAIDRGPALRMLEDIPAGCRLRGPTGRPAALSFR